MFVIVYEVNLEVDRGVAAEFYRWLRVHVAEIVALPGFWGADVYERRDPPAAEGRVAWCVQYRLHDADALQTYLREHAPRLRADGTNRFGSAFSATRRVLAPAAAP